MLVMKMDQTFVLEKCQNVRDSLTCVKVQIIELYLHKTTETPVFSCDLCFL